MVTFGVVGYAWQVKTKPSSISLSVKIEFLTITAFPSVIFPKQELQTPP